MRKQLSILSAFPVMARPGGITGNLKEVFIVLAIASVIIL